MLLEAGVYPTVEAHADRFPPPRGHGDLLRPRARRGCGRRLAGMRPSARGPDETDREPIPAPIWGQVERRDEPNGRGAAQIGRPALPGPRPGASFRCPGPDPDS